MVPLPRAAVNDNEVTEKRKILLPVYEFLIAEPRILLGFNIVESYRVN
jgi:hypothetical protein